MKETLLVFLKGMAMGAADVVPGVSGGTIAFITGIYDKLLESIRRINPKLVALCKAEGAAAVWQYINGSFLVALFAGVFTSILLLANVVTYALAEHPILIWSFFFGLILASTLYMIKQVSQWNLINIVLCIIGVLFAYGITISDPVQMEFSLVTVFIAGSIAICAMILPGISGSFILLLLGMYAPILDAVKNLHAAVLMTFLAGTIVGILSFSHVLSWLLRRYRNASLAFLIGFLIGALGKLWPWKVAISYRVNSSGEQVPLLEKLLTPAQFELSTGMPSQLLMAISIMLFGFFLVLGLEKLTVNKQG